MTNAFMKDERPGNPCRSSLPMLMAALLATIAPAAHPLDTPDAAPAASPTVVANHETLVGTYGDHQRDVASFKGIPFAAAPVGELRWKAPQPVKLRPGPQRARDFAAGCFQDSYTTDWYRRVGAAFGADASTFTDPPFSEDCLYLNVWTPSLKHNARLPVMVWIHGGANVGGWSYEPNYRGENLAARGRVVVVSIAYRLGIFGFFSHPELRGGAAPSNFGLLDQLAALRWVQQNIDQFGGDPHNVTVFGESAGAADIGYLITSPLARGLFQRVISQSGGYLMQSDAPVADAEKSGLTLASALPGHPTLDAMRRLPSATIFAAAKSALTKDKLGPVIDGVSLTQSPAAYFRQHGIAYDLLIGSNANEWYMYVDDNPAGLADALQKLPASVRGPLAARAAQEPDVRRGHDKVTALAQMACPTYLMGASAAHAGKRAWVYRFARIRPGAGDRLLAYHGAEIPYVFDTHDHWLSGDAVETDLTNAMVTYWSNFARTGNPNSAGLPDWPAFDSARPKVLELNTHLLPMGAPDEALCHRIAPALYPGW